MVAGINSKREWRGVRIKDYWAKSSVPGPSAIGPWKELSLLLGVVKGALWGYTPTPKSFDEVIAIQTGFKKEGDDGNK